VCDQETSWTRRPQPALGCSTRDDDDDDDDDDDNNNNNNKVSEMILGRY
jgi:hypothetical protein